MFMSNSSYALTSNMIRFLCDLFIACYCFYSVNTEAIVRAHSAVFRLCAFSVLER